MTSARDLLLQADALMRSNRNVGAADADTVPMLTDVALPGGAGMSHNPRAPAIPVLTNAVELPPGLKSGSPGADDTTQQMVSPSMLGASSVFGSSRMSPTTIRSPLDAEDTLRFPDALHLEVPEVPPPLFLRMRTDALRPPVEHTMDEPLLAPEEMLPPMDDLPPIEGAPPSTRSYRWPEETVVFAESDFEPADGVGNAFFRTDVARSEVARIEAERSEAARIAAGREEAARDEAARDEEARNEAARNETARNEAARNEAARNEAARNEAARAEAAAAEARAVGGDRRENDTSFSGVTTDDSRIRVAYGYTGANEPAPVPSPVHSVFPSPEPGSASGTHQPAATSNSAELAESVYYQVLQNLDLFTEKALQRELTAHLAPIIERANRELLATLHANLGGLLRQFIAEAIEKQLGVRPGSGDLPR